MKKLIIFLTAISVMQLMSCSQNRNQGNNSSYNSFSVPTESLFEDSSYYSIELRTISDIDFFLKDGDLLGKKRINKQTN